MTRLRTVAVVLVLIAPACRAGQDEEPDFVHASTGTEVDATIELPEGAHLPTGAFRCAEESVTGKSAPAQGAFTIKVRGAKDVRVDGGPLHGYFEVWTTSSGLTSVGTFGVGSVSVDPLEYQGEKVNRVYGWWEWVRGIRVQDAEDEHWVPEGLQSCHLKFVPTEPD
jgi:hypothetical protein